MNLSPDTITLLVAVLAVGIGLATLIMRSTSRLDADQHETQRRFHAAMETFRAEMQRLAERQSHV